MKRWMVGCGAALFMMMGGFSLAPAWAGAAGRSAVPAAGGATASHDCDGHGLCLIPCLLDGCLPRPCLCLCPCSEPEPEPEPGDGRRGGVAAPSPAVAAPAPAPAAAAATAAPRTILSVPGSASVVTTTTPPNDPQDRPVRIAFTGAPVVPKMVVGGLFLAVGLVLLRAANRMASGDRRRLG